MTTQSLTTLPLTVLLALFVSASLSHGAKAELPAETQPVTSVSEIKDLTSAHPAFEAVQSLVERYGILSVDGDSKFRPDAALQRGALAVWLNAAFGPIKNIRSAVCTDLAVYADAERSQIESDLGPFVDKQCTYKYADLADYSPLAWYATSLTQLIDTHRVAFAQSRDGKRYTDVEAPVTRAAFAAMLKTHLHTSDDVIKTAMNTIKPGSKGTGKDVITRAEAAVALEGAISEYLNVLQITVNEKVGKSGPILAAALFERHKIEPGEDAKKLIKSFSTDPPTRSAIIFLTHGLLSTAEKRIQAAAATPGLSAEKRSQLVALLPGRFSEVPDLTPAQLKVIPDLEPGSLLLGVNAYLESVGVHLRVRSSGADRKISVKPDRPATLDLVRSLLSAVLHDEEAKTELSKSNSLPMTLKRYLDAMDRHQAKIKTILEN